MFDLMPFTQQAKGERGHAGRQPLRARLHANKRVGRPLKRLAWSILIILPFGVSATEVYRTVDENGHITYSDLPSDVAERVTVRPIVDTFSASSGRESRQAESGPAGTDPAMAAQETDSADQSQDAPDRAQNCQVARERAEAYSASRRLFRTLPDGEREYLSSAEIDEARARAQSDVANWCD